LIKNSQPFGKNARKPQGDFLTHTDVGIDKPTAYRVIWILFIYEGYTKDSESVKAQNLTPRRHNETDEIVYSKYTKKDKVHKKKRKKTINY